MVNAGSKYYFEDLLQGVLILQYIPEVLGPGGPNTSKCLDPMGVYLLQRGSKYFEVFGPGGTFSGGGGSILFVTGQSEELYITASDPTLYFGSSCKCSSYCYVAQMVSTREGLRTRLGLAKPRLLILGS